MVFNKKRLYVALYPSGVEGNEERRYHWGFLIGPKDETKSRVPGMRYHVKNHPLGGWVYEEHELPNVRNTNNLLARIMIAKVEDEERLEKIFRNTSVVQDDPDWRCRTWMADALSRIEKDGKAAGTAQLDWEKIERKARRYVKKKADQGRYIDLEAVSQPKPTWDMLEGVETVP
ncbi:hypothetical protein C2857_003121 [Epichloe festucae Fl1]|uniref:Uncharacterized protein n=1 Tax=Epichloe festucae (strain Fl1) TaxID=877507 RepID=A0A7U3Q1X8_EPIFF|nr:hypothetical protein C2857_003121 [Epichloe festucae Fl1]